MTSCPFCLGDLPLNDGLVEGAEEQTSIRKRILSVLPSSYLAAGIGAMVYPYVLFVTRRHITGFDQASAQEQGELFELLKTCVESKLFPSGSLTLFEHGGSGEASCSCIDHCHIHIVDGHFDLSRMLLASRNDVVPWTMYAQGSLNFPLAVPYLWAAHFDARRQDILDGSVSPSAGLGQQYFRRVLAAWASNFNWDWKLHPHWENIYRLLEEWPQRVPHRPCL